MKKKCSVYRRQLNAKNGIKYHYFVAVCVYLTGKNVFFYFAHTIKKR